MSQHHEVGDHHQCTPAATAWGHVGLWHNACTKTAAEQEQQAMFDSSKTQEDMGMMAMNARPQVLQRIAQTAADLCRCCQILLGCSS